MAATGEDLLRALAKVRAADEDQGLVFSDVLLTPVQPRAAILSMVAMPGERRLWAYAWGAVGASPRVRSTVEPRNRDEEAKLWVELSLEIERLFSEASAADTWPQVLVPSGSMADFLAEASERFRWNRDEVALRRLSQHAGFLVDARERGLPILVVIPELVTAHVATGQSMHDDGHLGAVMAWLEAGPGAASRAAIAEVRPAGLLPDPDEDDARSELLAQVADLTRAGKPSSDPTLATLGLKAVAGIEAQAAETAGLVGRALDALKRQGLHPMATVGAISEECAGVFGDYWGRAGTGDEMRTAAKEPMWLSTQRKEDREGAASVVAGALVGGSAVRRAILQKDGKVIVARIVRVDPTVRRTVNQAGRPMRIHITTEQARARLRVGDSYSCLEVPNAQVILREPEPGLAVSTDGKRQAWMVEVRAGSTFLRAFAPGEVLNLIPNSPDLRAAWRRSAWSGGAREWIYGTSAAPSDRRAPAIDVEASLARLRRAW